MCLYLCSHCCHRGALSPCVCLCVFVFPLLPPGGAVTVCLYLCSHCCHQGAVSVCPHRHHQGALSSCMYVWSVRACAPRHHQGALSPCVPSPPGGAALKVSFSTTRGRCPRVCIYMCVCVPMVATRGRCDCMSFNSTKGSCHCVSPHHQGALFLYVCVCVCSPPLPPEGAVFACSPTTTTRGRCPHVPPPPISNHHHQGALSPRVPPPPMGRCLCAPSPWCPCPTAPPPSRVPTHPHGLGFGLCLSHQLQPEGEGRLRGRGQGGGDKEGGGAWGCEAAEEEGARLPEGAELRGGFQEVWPQGAGLQMGVAIKRGRGFHVGVTKGGRGHDRIEQITESGRGFNKVPGPGVSGRG